MKNRLIHSFIAAFSYMVILSNNLYAQQVVSSAGGNGQNSSGTISYTLGELVITSQSDGNNSLTQGFHQTWIIITAINDQPTPGFSLLAYPNPTYDFVTVKFNERETGDLECTLFNQLGQLLLKEKQIKNEIKISFEKYNPGIYFIKIMSEGKEIQTYKIIKK